MKRSRTTPPAAAAYDRVVDELAGSFWGHASDACRGDLECLEGVVTAGVVRQLQSLGMMPADVDPVEGERLMVDRLVTDALRRLQDVEGAAGEARRGPPTRRRPS